VPADDPAFPQGRVEVARAAGNVTGSGETDLVISYRRAASDDPVHEAFPDVEWTDGLGRTAHLAVYRADGHLRWGSKLVLQPIGEVTVCDGSLALGFTSLDDPAIIGGGAWLWDGFGFRTAPVLAGPATPICVDIDRDGSTEPLLIRT